MESEPRSVSAVSPLLQFKQPFPSYGYEKPHTRLEWGVTNHNDI